MANGGHRTGAGRPYGSSTLPKRTQRAIERDLVMGLSLSRIARDRATTRDKVRTVRSYLLDRLGCDCG